MLTSIQSAGVITEVNLKITQAWNHARDLPWLWNVKQTLSEVQNRVSVTPRKGFISQSYPVGTPVLAMWALSRRYTTGRDIGPETRVPPGRNKGPETGISPKKDLGPEFAKGTGNLTGLTNSPSSSGGQIENITLSHPSDAGSKKSTSNWR